MAYRRRQGITRASTFKEEIRYPPDDSFSSTSSSPSPSLAAQAIRASAAHRDSSLSSAYGNPTFYTSLDHSTSKGSACYEDASMKTDTKSGFWGILARKAKSILEEDDMSEQFESRSRMSTQALDTSTIGQSYPAYQSTESYRRIDNPRLKKGLDALTSSLNHIGDTFEKAFEEGRTIVENKTTDIIQETRKLQFRRKGNNLEAQNQSSGISTSWQHPAQYVQPKMQTNQETQLKASRDVAMATAAKAKLLIRELKTVKADLAFAKERCSQLEEENKILRERRVKGDNPADDDLIRLQLETLLAEKARLAHENSIYARENRFLREIIEYHQLTMQDVVYLDEGIEEVTEVYPISIPLDSTELLESPTSPHLNGVPSENIPSVTLTGIEEVDLPPSPSISVPLVSTERSECSVSPQFHGSSNKNVVNEEINMASISSPKDTDNSDDEIPLDTNVSTSSVHDIQKSFISS